MRPRFLLAFPLLIASVAVCDPSPVNPAGDHSSTSDHATGDDDDDDHTSASAVSDDSASTKTAPASAGGYDQAQMQKHLRFLASKELAGRAPGTPGDAAARKYVAERFAAIGVQPAGDDGSFDQAFTNSEKTKSFNVVGMIKGSDPKVSKDVIVLGAHIDHFGLVGGEGLRLGANDNASGVVAVLSIAEALVKRASPPRRTIAFMIFGSEELGCEGSHHYMKKGLKALPVGDVVYDINFDMVGTYTQNGGFVTAHGTVGDTPAASLIEGLIPSGLKVETGVPGIEEDDSDYSPFCVAGIPMVGFFTDDDPGCYHESCDTEDRIDYPHLLQIAKLGGDLAEKLADGEQDLAAYRAAAKVSKLGCEGYQDPTPAPDDNDDDDDDDDDE